MFEALHPVLFPVLFCGWYHALRASNRHQIPTNIASVAGAPVLVWVVSHHIAYFEEIEIPGDHRSNKLISKKV